MQYYLLIGLGAGLASAVLFASATIGPLPTRLLLYVLAPLPMFLAGLGWGAVSAIIAAVTGAFLVGAAANAIAGLAFFISQGLPVAILCYLVYLNRPAASSGDGIVTTQPAGVEWYPIGRLVAWAAVMAGALAMIVVLVLGSDSEQQLKVMREVIERTLTQDLPGLAPAKKLTDSDIANLARIFLTVLPGALASSWLITTLLNFWLAGRITRASGRLPRPWPDIAGIELPPGFSLALAGALALTFLPGLPRLIGSGFAGAFFLSFAMLGLAVIHYASRNHAMRPMILGATYFAVLFLSGYGLIAVALVGLAEGMLGLRQKFGGSPPRGPGAAPPGPPTHRNTPE